MDYIDSFLFDKKLVSILSGSQSPDQILLRCVWLNIKKNKREDKINLDGVLCHKNELN